MGNKPGSEQGGPSNNNNNSNDPSNTNSLRGPEPKNDANTKSQQSSAPINTSPSSTNSKTPSSSTPETKSSTKASPNYQAIPLTQTTSSSSTVRSQQNESNRSTDPNENFVPLQNGLPALESNSPHYFPGYCGLMERVEAEQILMGKPQGTFLIRWSENKRFYVITYTDDQGKFQHMGNVSFFFFLFSIFLFCFFW